LHIPPKWAQLSRGFYPSLDERLGSRQQDSKIRFAKRSRGLYRARFTPEILIDKFVEANLFFPSKFYIASMRKKTSAGNKLPTKSSSHSAAPPSSKPDIAGRSQKTRAADRKLPDPTKVAEIFHRFQAANPHPKGELEHVNAFTLLVAVVLSAQATDLGVNKATHALFAIADNPAKLVEVGETRLQNMIRTIGLYRTKAKNIIALSKRLIKEFGGEVPRSREALESLPGVGRKTANVVMNIAFGAQTIAVDTHIFRVANRIPLAVGRTPFEVESGLERIVPEVFKHDVHHWLILHGRYICKARAPHCDRCLISDLCEWPEKRA
jgi:endonuclease III